jgi:hypothetical protein
MKCIQCDTDNNLKDRTANQGRCKNCNHPFAFEPTTMEPNLKMTDRFFSKALADISASDTLYFTSNQLRYLVEKRLTHQAAMSAKAIKITCGGMLIFFGFITAVLGIGLVAIVIGIWIIVSSLRRSAHRLPPSPKPLPSDSVFQSWMRQWEQVKLSDSVFQSWMRRWEQVNPSPAKLLPAPAAAVTLAPVDDDVTAYSFDRVLVCDSVAIAQLLIANNIHFEHNCAVFSITGYPRAIFATTMAMLRRNPDLQVIALHDCSPSGMAMVHELRTSPDWFLDSTPVIFDLGMLPRQIAAARGQAYIQISADFAQAARVMPPEVSQQLTATELEWLEAGYFVDLESFTPKKLMQIVSHGIARLQNLGEDVDDNLILVGDVGSSGGTFIYASDNFG